MTKTKLIQFILGSALTASLAVSSAAILAEPITNANDQNDQSIFVTQAPAEQGNSTQASNASSDNEVLQDVKVTPVNTPDKNINTTTTDTTTNETNTDA